MAQKCVFCGGTPKNKNKEHVVPQWLSKYLGRYKAVCHLGNVTPAEIPFSALTFPACEKCNSDDANLEGAAKGIVEKLMESKSVTGQEVSILMDWFDKLRTGIWLGELMLSKRIDDIDPNFYINDRIGLKDRMLIIESFDSKGQGLGLAGVDTKMFMYTPSVFQLWMHNVLITSASATGLVSNKLGFPQMSNVKITEKREGSMKLLPGRNKTVHPVVMGLNATNKTILYQPIFKEFKQMSFYDVPYVHNHSYDYDAGIGGVFFQKNNNEIKYLAPQDKLNLIPKKQPESLRCDSLKRVFQLQNYVVETLCKNGFDNPQCQNDKDMCLRINNMYIKSLSR